MDSHQETDGYGWLIAVAKIFFTISGVILNLILLPYAFKDFKYLLTEFDIVNAHISLFNMLFVTGTLQAVAKYVASGSPAAGVRRSAYRFQWIAAGIFSVLFFPAVPLLLDDRYNNLVPALAVAGLIPVFYGFYAIHLGVMNGRRRFRPQALLDIGFAAGRVLLLSTGALLAAAVLAAVTREVPGPIGGSLFAVMKAAGRVWAPLFPFMLWAGLSFTFVWLSRLVLMRSERAASSTTQPAPSLGTYTKFAIAIILYNFSFYLLVQLDIFALEHFFTAQSVPASFSPEPVTGKVMKEYLSLYTLSLKIGRLNLIVTSAAALLLFPLLAGVRSDQQAARDASDGFRVVIFFLALIAGGIFAGGPYLLQLLPGNYAVSDGPLFARYLALSQAPLAFLQILLIAFLARGRAMTAAAIGGITALTTFGLQIPAISHWGAFGAIYGGAAGFMFWVVIAAVVARWTISIQFERKFIAGALLVPAAGIGLCLLMEQPLLAAVSSALEPGKSTALIVLLVLSIVYVLIFGALSTITGWVGRRDINSLRRLLFRSSRE